MAQIIFVPFGVGAGGPPTGPASGDLSGTYPGPTVDGLQTVPVSAAAPVPGDVLTLVAGVWTPAPGAGGGTLQSAYTGGATIATTAAKPIAFSNAVDAADLLTLTRTFVGAGDALSISMAAGSTGRGISIDVGGGTGIVVSDGVTDETSFGPGTITQSAGDDLDISVGGAVGGSISVIAGAGGGAPGGGLDLEAGTGTPSGVINIGEVAASDVNIGGALGIAQDFTLSARSASITLNQAGDESLDGSFTATSIIGALNELVTASGNSLQSAYDVGPDITETAADAGIDIDAGTAAAGNITEPVLSLTNTQLAPVNDVLRVSHVPTSASTGGNAVSIVTNNFSVGAALRIGRTDLSENTDFFHDTIQPDSMVLWSILPVTAGAATVGVNVSVTAGQGGTTGAGGVLAIAGGTGGTVNGDGGDLTVSGGPGSVTNGSGGDVVVNAGTSVGAGTDGVIDIGETTASAINIGAGLGAAEDLTFAARSGSITLNESGDTVLVGFTATSIVGALNELNSSSGGAPSIVSAPGAWTVPAGAAIADLLHVTGAFTADLADASLPATMPCFGVVIAKPTATTATVLYYGETPAIFGGLTIGAEFFVSTTAGAIVIAASSPSAAGEVSQRVGIAITATQLIFTPDPTTVNV